MIEKVKNTVWWTYPNSDLNREKIVVTFFEKELQKTIKKSLELIKKVIKRKGDRYMLNRKATLILFTVGLIKRKIKSKKLNKYELFSTL